MAGMLRAAHWALCVAAVAALVRRSSDFHDGTVVRLEGLQSTPQLDGQLGKIVGWDESSGSGQYVVEIAGGTKLLVAPSNVEKAAAGAASSSSSGGDGGASAGTAPGLKKLSAAEADAARYLFTAGSRVEIYGTQADQMNGQLATIVGLNLHLKPPKYIVQLASGEEMKVNPHKLRLTRASFQEGDAQPQSGGKLNLGAAVEAFGLKKLGQLNGEVGMVQGVDPKDGRYIVSFSSQINRPYSLKRQNLREALLDHTESFLPSL